MWGEVITNGPSLVPQLGSIVEHQETMSPLLSLDRLEGGVAWSIPQCCRLREMPHASLYLPEELIACPSLLLNRLPVCTVLWRTAPQRCNGHRCKPYCCLLGICMVRGGEVK